MDDLQTISRTLTKNKTLLLFLISLHFNLASNAQEVDTSTSRHLVLIEAGGSGGYGSLNYEYLLKEVKSLTFSARIGLSTYHLSDYTHTVNPDVIMPLAIYAYYGNQHHIDIGIGQTLSSVVYADGSTYEPSRIVQFHTNLSLGYRYQNNEGGMVYKVAYAPIIENNSSLRNWASFSVGYAFRKKKI